MRTIRTYIAHCDDGHDFFDCEFESEHRANSKANYEDAKRKINKSHGRNSRSYIILKTYIKDWC